MSVHEYQDVMVAGARPEGNRAGLSPNHPDLAPFFAEGWRISRHEWLDGGRCKVQLFREKPKLRLAEMLMAIEPEPAAPDERDEDGAIIRPLSHMHLTVNGTNYYLEAIHGKFTEQEARMAVEWFAMNAQRGYYENATQYRTDGAIIAVRGPAEMAKFWADQARHNKAQAAERQQADDAIRVYLAEKDGKPLERPAQRLARVIASAGAVDLRSPAEKAQDDAHVQKLRTAADLNATRPLSPIEYRARWQAGEDMMKATTQAVTAPPQPPASTAGAGAIDRWLLEFGAWLQGSVFDTKQREALADKAMVIAAGERRREAMYADLDARLIAAAEAPWSGAEAARAIWESADPDTGRPAIEGSPLCVGTAARRAWGLC